MLLGSGSLFSVKPWSWGFTLHKPPHTLKEPDQAGASTQVQQPVFILLQKFGQKEKILIKKLKMK